MANIYDDAVKALSTVSLPALCAWLGVQATSGLTPLRLAESVPAPTTTRMVDLLIAVGADTVLHLEFQTVPERWFAHRMLEYRLRLDRLDELAGRELIQHAVLLGPGRLPSALQRPRLAYSFEVHRLADEAPERFLADPALAPFATLARMADADRPDMLAAALGRIAGVSDPGLRDMLRRITVDLAAIRLDRDTISSTKEDSEMPIPSLLNTVYEEGREAGREEGREAGREEGREAGRESGWAQAAAAVLRHRFGPDRRIPGIARRLGVLGPDAFLERIDAAGSLDELDTGSPGPPDEDRARS